jgi:lipoprotein-releasing system permease protein
VLMVTLGVVSGFENTLSRIVSSAQGHVTQSIYVWHSLDELREFLKGAPGLDQAKRIEPFWNSQGLLLGANAGRGVLIEGRYQNFQLSDSAPESTQEQVLAIKLGKSLAEFLGVDQGDTVKLLLPGVIKGAVEARVGELVSLGSYEIESRYAEMNAFHLASFLEKNDPETYATRPGDAHGIRFFMDDSWSSVSEYSKLQNWEFDYFEFIQNSALQSFKNSTLQTYRDARKNVFRSVGYNKYELALIMGILVLVASLNVGATFVVLFLERERELAIMQAMGWSSWRIRVWMIQVAVALGVLVSGVAVVFSWFVGNFLEYSGLVSLPASVYDINGLPLTFEIKELLMVCAGGVLCCVFVAWLMGRKLSRVNLPEVLSYRRM